MSVHGDEGQLQEASSDSFWEVDRYKLVVRRHNDGHKLAADLMSFIQERAEVEQRYCKDLRDFSKRWNKNIRNGPEYGTTAASWCGILQEADSLADLHEEVKSKLMGEVYVGVKHWQKSNYKKVMSVQHQTKEGKELEDEFKKAQKPWSKRLSKVHKSRNSYFTSCKNEKTATNQEKNARGDSGISQDQNDIKTQKQLRKKQDRTEQCRREVEKSKESYMDSLNEIDAYNAKYVEDMTLVFDRAQELEEKRLNFVKEMLFAMHKCLDISVDPKSGDIYTRLYQNIEQADASKDLRWFSQNKGVDMAMKWPAFEEYSPEEHHISKKEKKGALASSDGITLVSSTLTRNHDSHPTPPAAPVSAPPPTTDPPSSQNIVYNNNIKETTDSVDAVNSSDKDKILGDRTYYNWANPFLSDVEEDPIYYTIGKKQAVKNTLLKLNGSATKTNANPFDAGDVWDEYDNLGMTDQAATSEPEPTSTPAGVPVRALYEYKGQEEDELSFAVGEVFIKTRDEDDQGWCEGTINGRTGLYPANYVEEIAS